MTSKNNRAPPAWFVKLCATFYSHWWIQTAVYSPETPTSGQNRHFFVPSDIEIWQMTLNNKMAPLLCYVKLCASLRSHKWIQSGITVRKCSIRIKIVDFVACDLEIWRITLENKREPLLCASSFVYHFVAISRPTLSFAHNSIAICEFKKALWPGNWDLNSVTLTFDL